MPAVAKVLAESLAEALARVEEAAGAIETGSAGSSELATVVSNLVTIWGLVERDPGVQAAALDVFEAAATLAHPEETSGAPRLRRMLRASVKRLRERLEAARPNGSAVCIPELRGEATDAGAAAAA